MTLVICSLAFLQSKLNQSLNRLNIAPINLPGNKEQKIDALLLRTLSFGNLPTIIDGLTIKTLGDANTNKVPKGTHPTSYYDLDAIVALDPMFSEIIPLANMLAVLRGDAPGARDLLVRSQDFVMQHLSTYSEQFKNKFWPHPWLGHLFLGATYLFHLDDLPHAALAFRAASSLPGAPVYLGRLEKRLAQPGGSYDVGVNLLKFQISGAKDEQYRAALEKKLLNLRISQYLFITNRAFTRFLANQPKSRFKNKEESNELHALWIRFSSAYSTLDPWGGRLSLNDQGKIVSTTPNEKVFSLD